MAVPIRSSRDIEAIRAAGRLAWSIIQQALAAARPGITTASLADLAERAILAAGAIPILRGHSEAGRPAFPAAASVCINEEAGVGIPGPRILREGDVVTVDVALSLDGWCADAASAATVGRPTPGGRDALIAGSLRAIEAIVAALRPGALWSAVGRAAHAAAAAEGLALAPGFGGHGIGRAMHEQPAAPLWNSEPGRRNPSPGQDFTLRPGMVLTVEPVFVQCPPSRLVRLVGADDGWTLLTEDRSAACSQERTVAVTRSGPAVLAGPEQPS